MDCRPPRGAGGHRPRPDSGPVRGRPTGDRRQGRCRGGEGPEGPARDPAAPRPEFRRAPIRRLGH